ncbi:hypothetical protein Q8A67_023168 [Cirrhinus molitorella]|uniref:Uncharacterized protein n=1 Tax=Cirrhinus molitorella TaxID=172907 RepID=A0AA88NZH8_9TELE|nr:hypothetical protein Q8A67_023168 [Cirrhinus molitorella]
MALFPSVLDLIMCRSRRAQARQTRDRKNKRGANSAFVLWKSRLSSEPPAESGRNCGDGGFERAPQTRPGTGDIRDPCALSAPEPTFDLLRSRKGSTSSRGPGGGARHRTSSITESTAPGGDYRLCSGAAEETYGISCGLWEGAPSQPTPSDRQSGSGRPRRTQGDTAENGSAADGGSAEHVLSERTPDFRTPESEKSFGR